MSASPSHPVAVPVDLQAGAVPKVLNLAEAAAFVRCSRAHLRNVKAGLNAFGDLDGFRYN